MRCNVGRSRIAEWQPVVGLVVYPDFFFSHPSPGFLGLLVSGGLESTRVENFARNHRRETGDVDLRNVRRDVPLGTSGSAGAFMVVLGIHTFHSKPSVFSATQNNRINKVIP